MVKGDFFLEEEAQEGDQEDAPLVVIEGTEIKRAMVSTLQASEKELKLENFDDKVLNILDKVEKNQNEHDPRKDV